MMNKSILLLSLLLSACSSSKKSTEVSTVKVDSVATKATKGVKAEGIIDTTTTSTGKVVFTEIEFFSQDSSSGALGGLSIDDGKIYLSSVLGAPIRAIRQKSYESTTEKKGESRETHEGIEERQSALLQREATKKESHVSPAPDPYRWRYIFYFSLVILSGALYIKRAPIVDWLRKMLRGLVKL